MLVVVCITGMMSRDQRYITLLYCKTERKVAEQTSVEETYSILENLTNFYQCLCCVGVSCLRIYILLFLWCSCWLHSDWGIIVMRYVLAWLWLDMDKKLLYMLFVSIVLMKQLFESLSTLR